MRYKIRKLGNARNIRTASGKAVPIVKTIDLMVTVGTSAELVTFLLADRLEASIILGCDF